MKTTLKFSLLSAFIASSSLAMADPITVNSITADNTIFGGNAAGFTSVTGANLTTSLNPAGEHVDFSVTGSSTYVNQRTDESLTLLIVGQVDFTVGPQAVELSNFSSNNIFRLINSGGAYPSIFTVNGEQQHFSVTTDMREVVGSSTIPLPVGTTYGPYNLNDNGYYDVTNQLTSSPYVLTPGIEYLAQVSLTDTITFTNTQTLPTMGAVVEFNNGKQLGLNFDVQPLPEPASVSVLALASLGWICRRKK